MSLEKIESYADTIAKIFEERLPEKHIVIQLNIERISKGDGNEIAVTRAVNNIKYVMEKVSIIHSIFINSFNDLSMEEKQAFEGPFLALSTELSEFKGKVNDI